jgi:hypothetical protein
MMVISNILPFVEGPVETISYPTLPSAAVCIISFKVSNAPPSHLFPALLKNILIVMLFAGFYWKRRERRHFNSHSSLWKSKVSFIYRSLI